MVEYNQTLDSLFQSLADATRRDMLRLLSLYEHMSIGEIAIHYKMSFAGAAKHLSVLESAKLIRKRKKGRMQIVSLSPTAFKEIDTYLEQYRHIWDNRFNKIEIILQEKR